MEEPPLNPSTAQSIFTMKDSKEKTVLLKAIN